MSAPELIGNPGTIRPQDLAFIRKAAQLFIPEYDTVVYGSRARGDHRINSDLDLGIFGSTKSIDFAIGEFQSVMHVSAVLPIVSVTNVSLATGLFLTHVLRDGLLIHEGSGEFRRRRLAAGLPEPQVLTAPVAT